MGVTAIPLPTLRLAKVPAVAVPDKVAKSPPNKPEEIIGVPIKTASVFLL